MSDYVAGPTKHVASAGPSAEQPAGRLYARLWRWHLLAALLVIPFVLWQSTTGTIYLWAEWGMDQAHPELRFVQPGAATVPPSVQLAAALEAAPKEFSAKVTGGHGHGGGGAHDHGAMTEQGGPPVQEIILSDDPRRSTQVMMLNESGLPYPIFVDPYSGRVLGSLTGSQWLPGLTKALHGGWPLGKPGSWLLELADGWAIFMILSGLYLWWPRQRGFLAALRPRFDRGARMAVRDLHAIVAVLFSAVFLFFLISALPWTAFWGGEVLSRVQTALNQKGTAGFSPGGASAQQMAAAQKPIDDLVAEARTRGISQALSVRLAPWPGAPLYIGNRNGPPSADRVILGNPKTGEVTRDALRAEQPVIPRMVGFGIHVHQGDFGLWNLWMNTAFALSLIWLTVTGVASWWMRRPRRSLGVPRKMELRWPRALIATAAAMCLLLPIFGASVLLLLGLERLLVRRGKPA
ncbi:PepSY domain-containing protein [Reyranella sp.]|jgi:uncharacterized iron-regulated membrane protein|uniref:PepSY-associated TM helix domain-containing protein n=1 Tax=Reyranella sp. TaxID=1929291 RepID=UPI000BC3A133|nr:PepSY domain-containing protein [Reyranella sp.]OYY40047.1 MAG: hypothetical protein B7Y57_18185 [Rhodospirillales bacterium 35-66-84]OYZ92456.1 MAG: hypothetical protein B7Y08_20780 [Rhodospirillales bacterium 24-66-33]OZB23764.1 MAG: hypothetical protein B7X63_17645 [Rhodospirillales bacterium 39-66-50]HQS17065.1 PepSY domain-containing protein [Reyranella sp.]HQT14964.1 PepSY domain-containing protein [Reyranella sp.]